MQFFRYTMSRDVHDMSKLFELDQCELASCKRPGQDVTDRPKKKRI